MSCRHPVHLLARLIVLVLESCDKSRLQYSLSMWQLPTEKPKILRSAEMRRWLIYAEKETFSGLPEGLTPRGHRNGASIMAYCLLKDYTDFCYVTDWEMAGDTFKRTYFCPNLVVDSEIVIFFTDLSHTSHAR